MNQYRKATSKEIAACIRLQVVDTLKGADTLPIKEMRDRIRSAEACAKKCAEWLEAQEKL
jgi:hypothetical protein